MIKAKDNSITSCTVNETTKVIAEYALHDCRSLTSIIIPNSVISIGNGAFHYCDKLVSIVIGDNVTSIGSDAFYYCNKLQSITVDENNTAYASQNGILYNKTKTEIVHIPKAITGSVTIPESVTSIGSDAFYGCNKLQSITVDENNTAYASQNGILYNKTKTEIVHIPKAITGSVTIPESVTSIGKGAFYDCSLLESITIPFVGASKDGTENTHFGYIFGAGKAYDSSSSISQNSNSVPPSLKTVIITEGTRLTVTLSMAVPI